ncbi:hypothetical protein H0H93_014172 [Arthromyces matolae]|nr:hypothetical protein H0H93_014172 [Arthromyces matolae]
MNIRLLGMLHLQARFNYVFVELGVDTFAVLPFFHIYGLVVNVRDLMSIVQPIVILTLHDSCTSYFLQDHVKYCMSGAAPLSGDLMRKLRQILPNAAIGQAYGLTETCTTLTMLPITQKTGTVGGSGQLLPGIKARVVKPDGSMAGEGEQGELVVTGPAMALRYTNNEAATKETFIDGWEIMKVRGFQVAPAELEGHLLTHPDVVDACVVSVLDDYSGELPFAFVVLSEIAARRIAGNAQAALQAKAAIAKHVADVKVPYKHLAGGIEFIDVVPKNPSGKILRRILRDEARKLKVNSTSNEENRAKL